MKILSGIAISLLASLPLAAQDDFWGEEDARKACEPFQRYQPGPASRPAEADRKAFEREKNCFGHFYDPDGKPEYDKARRCCLVRGDCNRELAMIFANGWGTARDLDAATYFLCRAGNEMAPAEHWSMLQFVDGLRTGKGKGKLDYCEHITSGMGGTWCASLDLERNRAEWERRAAAVERDLKPEARPAFAALRKAADALVEADAHYMAEPNRGGTIYPSVVLGSQIERNDDFFGTLERCVQKRVPAATPDALKKADAALNTAYKAILDQAKADDQELEKGTTGQDVLRSAQRAWIPYRDAWIAFYRLRWKGAAPDEVLDREIAAAITQQRTRDLNEFGAEP